MSPFTFVLLVVVACACATSPAVAYTVRFEISTDPKCFDEEVREGVLVAGSYVAVNDGHGEPFKVNAQVTDPSGQQLHWQHDVAEGHFGFTADETGEFSVCFWLPHEGHHDAKRTHKIDITWTTGSSQKSVSHAAKKERLDRTHKIDITWTTGSSQKSVSHATKKDGWGGAWCGRGVALMGGVREAHEGQHDAKRTHKINITWTTGSSQKPVSHAAKERLDVSGAVWNGRGWEGYG
ncbi:unnamed protein product [Closterium sp. NIES-53]